MKKFLAMLLALGLLLGMRSIGAFAQDAAQPSKEEALALYNAAKAIFTSKKFTLSAADEDGLAMTIAWNGSDAAVETKFTAQDWAALLYGDSAQETISGKTYLCVSIESCAAKLYYLEGALKRVNAKIGDIWIQSLSPTTDLQYFNTNFMLKFSFGSRVLSPLVA